MPTAAMEVDKGDQEMVAGASGVESKAPVRSKGVSADDDREAFSPDLLRIYYARLFPYEQMYRWLGYSNMPASLPDSSGKPQPVDEQADFFSKREFSFTIEDDVYIRYQCFADQKEFEQQVQRKQPHKIDIGAIFTLPPKNHLAVKPGAFQPVERELVFDIDLTDYDDVRTCCSGAKICNRCWSYMTMAVEVMDVGLRQDFGFKHILWVYSGRRGVHCWVADDAARALTNEGRGAVADYFGVVAGNDNQSKKVNVSLPIHPSLRRAYETLEPLFLEHIITEEGQGLLSDPSHWGKLLATVPEDVRQTLEGRWKMGGSSPADKWEELVEEMEKKGRKQQQLAKKMKPADRPPTPEQWRYEVVFEHTYPRLDVNVSKGRNHLLKSPFAVHPKTGRVCVPIDPAHVREFDPFTVPTLGQLQRQIDKYDKEHGEETKSVSSINKTEMKKYVQQFEDTFLTGLYKGIRVKKRDRTERIAAVTTDF
ncbi:conserved unknown protein [Ectocarpus siliculosus]|uniref:DNA primase n=1 Tax=Ectocarpus siliculosus TaxID=2880 RepID=D7G7Y8_ECTSI|nr:conserved unknown protein [Ectocarpus siliculosus]|eukprot:CBJ27863.1 conserved unknown protein [Ectocarpus siliculosus]